MKSTEKERLTVYLPPDLYKRLMKHCVDVDEAATRLVERLIREHLAQAAREKRG